MQHKLFNIKAAFTTCLGISAIGTAQAQMAAFNIMQQPDSLPLNKFIGQTATAHPITTTTIPTHPFMAPNGKSNTHNDAYMSDTYTISGPLGQNPVVRASSLGGVCVTMAFDSAGRIVTVCPGITSTRLFLIEPGTETLALKTLAYLDLPTKTRGASDFSAGGYFFLDNRNHALIPTIERSIWDVAVVTGGATPGLKLVKKYDLTTKIPEDDAIGSVLPDFRGRLWFVTKHGIVGTISRKGDQIATLALVQETIDNSFAMDETGGVFIASSHAMYRFDAGTAGEPVITWRETYNRGYRVKPGQVAIGTGTTPTLMGTDFVTITDNADPRMHVLVYRRAAKVDQARLVCTEPVFMSNRSATENSLIATDHSIIVENNYGYGSIGETMYGQTTEPGVTRIDLDDQDGCHTVWMNMEHVPSVVSKLSLDNGLIYTYTKDQGPGKTDAWYFTAIDFTSGQTVFKQLTGTGYGYNNHYAGVYLGPDHTAYVGVLNGLIAIRDQ